MMMIMGAIRRCIPSCRRSIPPCPVGEKAGGRLYSLRDWRRRASSCIKGMCNCCVSNVSAQQSSSGGHGQPAYGGHGGQEHAQQPPLVGGPPASYGHVSTQQPYPDDGHVGQPYSEPASYGHVGAQQPYPGGYNEPASYIGHVGAQQPYPGGYNEPASYGHVGAQQPYPGGYNEPAYGGHVGAQQPYPGGYNEPAYGGHVGAQQPYPGGPVDSQFYDNAQQPRQGAQLDLVVGQTPAQNNAPPLPEYDLPTLPGSQVPPSAVDPMLVIIEETTIVVSETTKIGTQPPSCDEKDNNGECGDGTQPPSCDKEDNNGECEDGSCD